jgi:hypothetical protein
MEGKVEAFRREGVESYKARRYFQAIHALESALEIAHEDEKPELKGLLARARSALGVELFNAGEMRQAEEAFQEALKQAEDSYAHFGLGFLHFVRFEDTGAQEHLKEALQLEPGYAKTHKLLGLIDYRQGRTAQALQKMEKAYELDPKDRETKALLDRWKLESGFTGTFSEKTRGRFLVRADPSIAPGDLEAAVQRLERVRKEVGEALGLRASRKNIVVVLFSEDRFHKATGSYHWVGGVYDGQIKLPVPRGAAEDRQGSARELEESARHEITHLAIRALCPECPNWLNEGIAQHFERKGREEETRRALLEGVSKRIRFRDVPSRLWEVDNEELARWTYLQGLGFVEFLVKRFQEFRLRLLLEAIASEGSVSKAFELTYGLSLESAEGLWWKDILAR